MIWVNNSVFHRAELPKNLMVCTQKNVRVFVETHVFGILLSNILLSLLCRTFLLMQLI